MCFWLFWTGQRIEKQSRRWRQMGSFINISKKKQFSSLHLCFTLTFFQRHVVQPTYRRNMQEKRKWYKREDPSRPSWLCVNVNNSHKISDSLAYHQVGLFQVVMWCNSPSTLNYSLIIFVKKKKLPWKKYFRSFFLKILFLYTWGFLESFNLHLLKMVWKFFKSIWNQNDTKSTKIVSFS